MCPASSNPISYHLLLPSIPFPQHPPVYSPIPSFVPFFPRPFDPQPDLLHQIVPYRCSVNQSVCLSVSGTNEFSVLGQSESEVSVSVCTCQDLLNAPDTGLTLFYYRVESRGGIPCGPLPVCLLSPPPQCFVYVIASPSCLSGAYRGLVFVHRERPGSGVCVELSASAVHTWRRVLVPMQR